MVSCHVTSSLALSIREVIAVTNLQRWLLVAGALVLGAAGGFYGGRRGREPVRPPAPPPGRAAIIEAFEKLYYEADVYTWSNTYWRGAQVLKNPMDLWVFQEIIYDTKPDVIVETGTYLGGSAFYFGDIQDLMGRGKVVTIDIKDYEQRRKHPRVHFLLGSSTDPAIVEKVKSFIGPRDKVMATLDSDHSKPHVLEELRIYSKLVTPGNYLVVEDTNINGHPVAAGFGPGPMEAVEEFLRQNPDFQPDHMREKHIITHNPRGFLRRLR